MSLVILLGLSKNKLMIFLIVCIILVANLSAILYMIFADKRSPQKILLWFVTILAFPLVGFVFFLYLGKGPSIGKRRKLLKKIQSDENYSSELMLQANFINRFDSLENQAAADIVQFNIKQNKSICTFLNDVKLYTNISEHFDDMLKDIRAAKRSINFEYFIIKPDMIGKMFRQALIDKAKEGVKVRVIYDDFGSIKIKKSFFKGLKKVGGEVYRFFPSFFRYISRNVNYRNHRKIVVIDDRIAYTGGSNIGAEYIGQHKRITPWRDTHIRLIGRSVDLLNMRFMQDFNFASGKEEKLTVQSDVATNNILPVQIVSSGPDEPNYGIEKAYIKAIYSAKKRIYIQTPYFVPSCCLMTALKTAAKSGVDVRVMIPKVPDKSYAYHCTTAYATELVESGAKVYMWNGFIHSKTMVIDDSISSVGTVNLDYRSFNLHFEVTTFIYDDEFGRQMKEVFENDLNSSIPFDEEYIKSKSLFKRLLERLMRLFSEVM